MAFSSAIADGTICTENGTLNALRQSLALLPYCTLSRNCGTSGNAQRRTVNEFCEIAKEAPCEKCPCCLSRRATHALHRVDRPIRLTAGQIERRQRIER